MDNYEENNEDFESSEDSEEFGICDAELIKKNEAENFKKNDKLIKAQKKKLLKILSKVDDNLIKICDSLIDNIAFMSVTLDELIKSIKSQGVKEFYKNGRNQFGFKESVESQAYNKYMKSFQSSMKLLIDMLTKDDSNNGEDIEALKKFFARGRK